MAAGKPHSVVAPSSLASPSSESESFLTFLVGLWFLFGFLLVWFKILGTFFREVFLIGVESLESSELLVIVS